MTANRSCIAKKCRKNFFSTLYFTSLLFLLAPFTSKLVNYSRHSEEVFRNRRHFPSITAICRISNILQRLTHLLTTRPLLTTAKKKKLCSDAIYQYTYCCSYKSRQMRLIITIFNQVFTFSIIWSVYRLHRVIFLAST